MKKKKFNWNHRDEMMFNGFLTGNELNELEDMVNAWPSSWNRELGINEVEDIENGEEEVNKQQYRSRGNEVLVRRLCRRL